jgi:hypothetical protein
MWHRLLLCPLLPLRVPKFVSVVVVVMSVMV